MLARRLTTILPTMPLAKAIGTTHICGVAGLTGNRTALVTTRPFRAPHHTISEVGRIGGGHVPMPGDVSLAHHGVLFLEAWPKFRRHVLRSYACRSRRVSSEHDLARIRDLAPLATLVALVMPVTTATGVSAWDLSFRKGHMAPGEWSLRDAWPGSGVSGLRPRVPACPGLSPALTTSCPAHSALLDRS